MLGVRARENESFEGTKRRFKRLVEKSGRLADWRKNEFYVPPSQIKKRANAQAEKRHRKRILRDVKIEQERRMRVRGRGTSGTASDAYAALKAKMSREQDDQASGAQTH
jgi:small subunit ribosomal protein S21